jgi:hypothetical protein
MGEDGYDGVDVGLDKHFVEHRNNQEKAESFTDTNKNYEDNNHNNKEITSRNERERTGQTVNPTQLPHPTQMTAIPVLTTVERQPSSTISEVVDMSHKIYRLGSTDNWACKNCSMKGDTWFMKKHICKGATK